MRFLLLSLICCLIILVGLFLLNYLESNHKSKSKDGFIQYGNNVKVSKNIVNGFENEDYIPRSVSINKKLRSLDGS
jgi:hypothetical protein